MQPFKHFELEKVSEGIYAAIAKEGSGAVGNAGFVDLGDKTIIFDTFNTQQAAHDLKFAAEKITQKSVSWVINSHWHGDHIRGNQVFKDKHILASQTTYEKMKAHHPARIKKQKDDVEGLKTYIQSLEERKQALFDPNLDKQIHFLNEILISLPTLELTLPDYSYNNEFSFYGTKRTARLLSMGNGHSDCDSILYLPEDHVVFMGDLLFIETHPSLFPESNLQEWVTILTKVLEMPFNLAVPGHGPIGTKHDVQKLLTYFKHLEKWSREYSDHENIIVPEVYKNWASPETFVHNLKRINEYKG